MSETTVRNETPTVFVVDDQESVRKAVTRVIESTGMRVEAFATAEEFLGRERGEGPSCLVLDVRMPKVSGLDLQKELVAKGVDIPIIFLTGHGTVETSVEAMKAGAADFIQKPLNAEVLLDAVQQAIERDAEAIRKRRHREEVLDKVKTLTPREKEVFLHVITGQLNKQIAADLGTSEKTIKVHRGRVMRKLEAESVAELVRLAQVAGVTEA